VNIEEKMDIFIHIAILKESSNRLLQERQARREAETAQFQSEKFQTEEISKKENLE